MLFLIYHGFEEYNGISKKIKYQMQAFRNCGIDTHICFLTDQQMYKRRWIDDRIIKDYGNSLQAKILKRTDFECIVNYVKQEGISFVYIRHDHNANPFTISLYRKLKKAGCKIALEIPTYPYDQEYRGFPLFAKLDLYIDQCFRKIMAKHIDRIVTFTSKPEIWSRKTIRISNGIDFEQTPIKQSVGTVEGQIHLIAVAEIHRWHGLDRVLTGLVDYYRHSPQSTVVFHIVGTACEKDQNEMVEIINNGKIQDFVIFHGRKFGAELNELFDHANIGIGSLGRHRSNITNIKTLKNREYAARGIPFIYSETDEDFDNAFYVHKVLPNESPVDIFDLISFYQSRSWNSQEIRDSISHLSWTKQMKKVITEMERS